MGITVRSKQELKNRIIEAKIGMKMSQDILAKVKEFEHRKQVNKTFTDSFEELGYHAYICKDKFSSKLVIRKRVEDEAHTGGLYTYVELSLYHSEVMSRHPFSWEDIKKCVEQYNYAGRLKEAEEALNVADSEVEELEKFVKYVESQDFKCVDLWRIKSDLKEALSNVKSNMVQR